MQLSEAEHGDRYEVTPPGYPAYVARILDLEGRLWVVIDYTPEFPADDIPEPWTAFEWRKVQ